MIPERLARTIAALLVPVGLVVMVTGSGNVLGLGGLLAVAAVVVALGRPRKAMDPAWVTTPAAPGPATAPARGSVPRALGAVETRELLLNPWFHGGVGFCIIFLVAINSFEKSWWSSAELFPIFVHPLCGLTIVAVHRNATRPPRDGADELFDSCPADASDRQRARLLAGIAPVAIALAFVMALLVGSAVVLDGLYGPMGARVVFNVVVAAVLLPVGAVALGLALARVANSTLAPIAAVGFVALVNIILVEEPDGLGWFATARIAQTVDVVFVEPPLLGRLLWIVGLVAATACLAIPMRRSIRPAVLGGVVALVLAGSFLNLRDLPEPTVARLAGYASVSDEYSSCIPLIVEHDVEVCAPLPYEAHGRAMADNLRPVMAALPDDAVEDSLVLGLTVADTDGLQTQVRERLERDGLRFVVPLPFGHHRSHFGAARFEFAAIVTGVFTGDDPENVLVGGEARGVVLIWIATRGLPDDLVDRILRPYSTETASHAGHIWPGICGAPIQWAPQDISAARLLARHDEDAVQRLLAADWTRWLDPATSTDDLLGALGLPAQGPTSPIAPLGGIC